MSAIETNDLTKEFDGLTAVNSLNLKIEEGELFGLLGPNGAGKTTIIKMLSTLIKPSSGSGRVAGYDIQGERDKVRQSIGIVFQDISLDTELTGWENLDFHARMYGMEKELRKERIAEVLKLVSLEDKADQFVKYYSGGMQRRLEIARGLMHYPKVLFLDEPTLGLDAQTRHVLWDYIKELARREKITIILTTHYMDEADYLCDRIGIVDYGKIVVLGTSKELKEKVGEDLISLEITGRASSADSVFEGLDGVLAVNIHDNTVDLSVKNAEKRIPLIIETSRRAGIEISSVNMRKPTLEDVFLHYTGRTIRGEGASGRDMAKQDMRNRRQLWGGRKK
ncbi:daunorubicin/doxorubicin resistance ATP-binding protein DrrA [archaeon BMS3Abin16]|nr:daunorubicin/doxorubicin resistance ATP-binding protein DrrA [archaeon BMS3Abin16]